VLIDSREEHQATIRDTSDMLKEKRKKKKKEKKERKKRKKKKKEKKERTHFYLAISRNIALPPVSLSHASLAINTISFFTITACKNA
jgi:hypothetical protein